MSLIAVIDIGKTNAKLALVDAASLAEVAVVTRPNRLLDGPPWPHFDLEGHWRFLLDGLARFHREHGISAIVTTTHGASAVMLDAAGALAAPMLDYEHAGPDQTAAAYDAVRPSFDITGSPRLPAGLNLGAQLFWQFRSMPDLHERVAQIVTYPQYWGFRLTGIAATDWTSLGCHTDLWDPHKARFSALVETLHLSDKLAPVRPCDAILGPLLPEVAAQTGLDPATPVYCGIHDSNASLLPHIVSRAMPFSVVSTGTWVIAMAVHGAPVVLDANRDTLINVSAHGLPVPSARFMGGREFERALAGQVVEATPDALEQVLRERIMLLPSLAMDSGPFQGSPGRWVGAEPAVGSATRAAAVAVYLAMVTARCLDLIGHRGTVVVEGPFARNKAYVTMLAAVTGSPVEASAMETGTAQGAAMLVTGVSSATLSQGKLVYPDAAPSLAKAYGEEWARLARDI